MTVSDKRAGLIADIVERTGIDEAMIERVVRRFYEKVREDAMLGPVFDAKIADWEPHLNRMFAFWSSVALMSGRYHGRPMEKHQPLPVDARHFDRWLLLFAETVQEICPGAAADHFLDHARRIARSLEMGIASCDGVILGRNARLNRPDARVSLPGTPPNATDRLP